MLPPIDSAVLKNNPQFANLYKGLTELILNDDGSTKLQPQDPVAQERKEVTEELNKHRLAAAKETLLIHALSTTSPDPVPIPEHDFSSGLPRHFEPPPTIPPNLKQPLTDLLLLLPSFLSLDFSSPEPPLDSDSLLLILTSPPLSLLPSLLPYLGPLLSMTLHSQASHLVHLANHLSHPSSTTSSSSLNPANTSCLTIPTLPTAISHLTTSTLPTLHSSVLHSRLEIAEKVRDLLSKYSTAFTFLIKALEAKHGAIARSLEFKATETALLAQKAEKECELVVLGIKKEVYTPEVRKALRECYGWLVSEQKRIREEIKRGREVVRGYGVCVEEEGGGEGEVGGDPEKEKVMREIARVYAEMEREVEVVKRDLERLGGV